MARYMQIKHRLNRAEGTVNTALRTIKRLFNAMAYANALSFEEFNAQLVKNGESAEGQDPVQAEAKVFCLCKHEGTAAPLLSKKNALP